LPAGERCLVVKAGAGKRIQVELLETGVVGWLTTALKTGEQLVGEGADAEPPTLVMVTVADAMRSSAPWVELFVLASSTLGDVRDALAKKLDRPEVLHKGRFVLRKGNASFAGLRLEEPLGERRDFFYMGTEL